MTEAATARITVADDRTELGAALDDVAGPIVGVDVERADGDRYFREAALIQVGVSDGCVLVDPLSIEDLGPLEEFLAGRTAVLHSIENDVAPLDAAGLSLDDVADTQVAAAMLGMPTGLERLLEDILGVELSMDKSRYQRADWSRRPLSDGMAAYAAGDVVHLPALWWELQERLEETGRTAWYRQELAATIARARADTRDWRRTKGAAGLSPSERAVLAALWEERETIAREHDIAPNLLLHDSTLRQLAEDPAEDADEIVRRDRRPADSLREHAPRLLDAQRRGLSAEPIPRDPSRRWSDGDRDAHDAMRRLRNRRAEELGMDPGVLCPNRQLWDAVAADPSSADELVEGGGLLPWQGEALGAEELWQAYVEARGG